MGNDSVASAAGSHPRHRLFGQATPGPTPHPTTGSRSPGQEDPSTRGAESATNPLTQRGFDMRGLWLCGAHRLRHADQVAMAIHGRR
jgi:hypothetical protein